MADLLILASSVAVVAVLMGLLALLVKASEALGRWRNR